MNFTHSLQIFVFLLDLWRLLRFRYAD